MNRVQKRWKGALAWILAFLMVCSIITPVVIPRKAKAADIPSGEAYVTIDGKNYKSGTTYTMYSKFQTLTLPAVGDWTQLTGSEYIDMCEKDISAKQTEISNAISIVLKAQKYGDTKLQATYKDSSGNDVILTITVHVGFSVNFGKNFEYIDGVPVIVLEQYAIQKLELIFPTSAGYTAIWSSGNQDVFTVSVDETTASENNKTSGDATYVIATGAGKASLYLKTNDKTITGEKEQRIDVYVLPKASKTGSGGTWIDKDTSQKEHWEFEAGGGSFFVNTSYEINQSSSPSDKIAWAVRKVPDKKIGADSGSSYEFLTDSYGSREGRDTFSEKEVNSFSLSTSQDKPNRYTVKGVAGRYQLFIFLAGTYVQDPNVTNAGGEPHTANAFNRPSFNPIVINFSIAASTKMAGKSIDISMIAGDSLDLSSVFGTSKDFLDNLFALPTVDPSEQGLIEEPKLQEQIIAIKPEATGSVTVTLTGTPKLTTVSDENTSWSDIAQKKVHGDTITIKIHISTKFELNITNATIYKGKSINLTTILMPRDVAATYSWTSSDPNCASVTSSLNTATVKALKATQDKTVTITVVCTLSSGVQRRATCTLQILDAVNSIKFNHDELEVESGGDPKLLKVELGESQSGSMNLLWRSSDETIATVEPSGNSESAYIYGKKVGTAIVWVENADNFVYATCKVRVYSGVTSIEFVDVKDPVKVNKAQKYLQLNLKVTLSDGTVIGLPELSEYNVDLDWKVGNQSVLDVTNETGLIALKSSGTSRVAVTAAKTNPLVAAYVDITVTEQTSGLAINPSSATVEQGSTVTLNYVLSPSDSGAQLTWSSLDTKIATVTQKGVVSGIKAGQTYIILKTDDGQVATALVTVTQKASGITLDVYNVTVGVGDSYTVTAKPNPSTSTETSFTWTSKDPTIATVKDGVVTGVKAGQTIVLVKSSRGAVEYLYVTVQQDVLGMTLNYNKKEIAKGKTFTLKAVFNPEKVTNTNVKWSSSDEKIATVNTSGKVKGIKGGTAVITAVSEDGGYLDYCIVEVTQLSTGIKLNYSSKKIPLKGKVTLKATISGNTSKNQTLKWSSNNTSIATVSNKGVVTAKSKVGTCVITCKTTDGSGEKATCTIRVYRKITSLSLNKSTIKIREGKTYRITAKVKPSNATYKSVTWSTSDPDIATIDSKGYITAVKAGSCKVYATAKDGTKKKASCWVYVLENVPSTAVTLESSNMVMVRGTKSVINYTLSPANSTDTVTFSSNNKAVATVSSTGNVTAKKVGTATITIRSSSGKRALLTVTVIGLNKTSLYMEQYDTENLWIEGASNVVWDSTNPSVATVSGGRVTARKPGTATIIASVNGVKMYCNVTVVPIKQ